MLNTDDFIQRLEKLMEYYNLSASIFADKIGVQRSGISHLLSGRNKPSLDFVMKIYEVFPEIDLYWLLNGKGDLVRPSALSLPSESLKNEDSERKITEAVTDQNNPKQQLQKSTEPGIYKIVIFYDDGSFSDFYPNT